CNGPNDIERVVTIERRNLDGHNIFNLRKLSPEFVGKHAPTHRGLQIETHNRQDRGDFLAMVDDRGVLEILYSSQTQKTRVVFQIPQELRFANGLRRFSADAANAHQRHDSRSVRAIHLLSGEAQYRLE